MLEIRNLSKTYKGGKTAVNNLSLHVRPGDIYGFIGHNGAGKTTTLRAVVGALDFENGDIYIDKMSIKTKPVECKRIMAYIPDNPELYENLTGIQYIKFISDIYGISKKERMERISKYADAFEMTPNLGDIIGSYSHGMKQKLAIISALVHMPKLMVLDEPFVGLDPKAAYTLKGFIAELCSQGSAVFFSTHVLDTAEKLCNRIAIIKEGILVAEGETEKVIGDASLEQVFLELTDNE
ncbi:MAG: ABC transporter ATP-binding protein [Clostridiales bacterium]|jgi:ABC-2 type transport system ATP-binding protein|nr:ABC transporter ATP-binding protein [Clostridiales bacterium]